MLRRDETTYQVALLCEPGLPYTRKSTRYLVRPESSIRNGCISSTLWVPVHLERRVRHDRQVVRRQCVVQLWVLAHDAFEVCGGGQLVGQKNLAEASRGNVPWPLTCMMCHHGRCGLQ